MTPGTITNKTIFTINWAHGDPRSAKASLAGRGDGRALWWESNRSIHQLVRPRATSEEIMFSFHARHHRITLSILKFRFHVKAVFAAIRSEGVMAGFRTARSLSDKNAAF